MDKELIRVENLKKYYDIKGGIITHTVSQIQAVDGIDFSIKKGRDPWTGWRIRLWKVHDRPAFGGTALAD